MKLEEELAGRTVLLQGTVGLAHAYGLYRTDVSGVGTGEPIAKVERGSRATAGYMSQPEKSGLSMSAGRI